jgi:NitT/TauT family transport system substrate-binding protein
VMGDYPLVVNGSKFQETKSLRTIYVTGTGYNLKGAGNAIVVPVSSSFYKLEDLKGKAISTPVGSASWGMLIKALQDKKMPLASIELKNQAPAVGAANIATNKIDAHSDFCPWSEIMEFRGSGRKIYDGSETGIPYLHGAVVRQDFAEKYPEVVIAFIKAVYDAGKWIDEDPKRATEMMEKWTGVEKEVLYLYFSKGGHLTQDPTIKQAWIDTLKLDHGVLIQEKLASPLNFDSWITEDYIRRAYAEMGLDYEADKAKVIDTLVTNAGRPNEIWHARDGILSYPTTRQFLQAVAEFQATGTKLNSTYVYDHATGLKLFGKTAFYVRKPDGQYVSFLRKGEADEFAAKEKGTVLSFEQAVASSAS